MTTGGVIGDVIDELPHGMVAVMGNVFKRKHWRKRVLKG